MVSTSTLKEIEKAKANLAKLEKKAAEEQNKRIGNLHKEAGFKTRQELIEALQALGGAAKRGRKPAAAKVAKVAKAAKAPKAKKAAGAAKRAKRTKITAELKAQILDAVNAGGKGTDIAKQFGISIPSLHNIKKAAGLTKARGKK